MMTLAAAAALALSVCPASAAEKPAMAQLLREAGIEFAPYVAAPAGAPARMPAPSRDPLERTTVACVMDLEYKETVSQLVILRLWKQLDGRATVSCDGMSPVRLRLRGEGLSLGLGLPNESPFRSVNGAVAGSLSIRLPAVLVPHQLEGTYHSAGGEVLGGGLSFSPWVNVDGAFNTTLYLPTTLNASAAINLSSLTLRLE